MSTPIYAECKFGFSIITRTQWKAEWNYGPQSLRLLGKFDYFISQQELVMQFEVSFRYFTSQNFFMRLARVLDFTLQSGLSTYYYNVV